MIFEELREQLNGESCYPGFIAKTPDLKSGQYNYGWITRRRSNKKRFQCCLDSDGYILNLWAIQSHSGENRVDLSLQDSGKNHVRLD